ncbi:MAG: tRNA (adenosine(37)-N6)-dimethylallyltransferase MiaA [Prevotella sp.]|nr:tRNA (adenosine(37)-N6)-dimethylallyltransferase MiaA [Staphylococcus sp.]MCM1349654.1 tRNA (adenosine(37)-N6)-dimethylallyltransferase MiaA [Prevotella sp.]
MRKVVVITGPTAVGKTKLAIAIAQRFHTDIINGDAYQIYKHMNIGTAKPSMVERQGIFHHMMDILSPYEDYSIADYQRDVRKCIDELMAKEKLPLIVGGSGLYIDAVIKDYRFDEEKRNDNLEERYQHLSDEALHHYLSQLDKDAASMIHPHNRKRILRAIELASSSVSKDSRAHREHFYYETLIIFLNDAREALYQRINQRVLDMVDDGLIEEVSSIGEENFSRTSKVAIGYKECLSYLKGDISKTEMIEQIQKNSRHYAKRQFTWFRNKTSARMVDIDITNFQQTVDEVQNLILQFLEE